MRNIGRRGRNIWAAGPLPAAADGAEVFGVSDAGLQGLRRSFASVLKPSAGGRSSSILLPLERGPTWAAQ
eukprot:4473356-Pyramimonas_sp.AAC.1